MAKTDSGYYFKVKRAAQLDAIAEDWGAHATPFHDKPVWWTATVNGRDAANEHYGLYRSKAAAERFCARIPAPAYTCKAEPLIPESEWMRKGAR